MPGKHRGTEHCLLVALNRPEVAHPLLCTASAMRVIQAAVSRRLDQAAEFESDPKLFDLELAYAPATVVLEVGVPTGTDYLKLLMTGYRRYAFDMHAQALALRDAPGMLNWEQTWQQAKEIYEMADMIAAETRRA